MQSVYEILDENVPHKLFESVHNEIANNVITSDLSKLTVTRNHTSSYILQRL